MQQNNKDLNGTGTQKDFLFLLVTQTDVSSPPPHIQAESFKVLEEALLQRLLHEQNSQSCHHYNIIFKFY